MLYVSIHLYLFQGVLNLCFACLITYLLTYSMQRSPCSQANSFSASQEILHILWYLKVHYRNHKCPRTVPILSQLDPVHTPTFQFLKTILILSCHLRLVLPGGLFHSVFPTKTLYTSLLSPIHATCSAHLIPDFITRTIFGEQY